MQSNKFYDSWLQANALARFMHDLSRTWGQHPKSGADSEAVGDFEDELWLMQNKRGQNTAGNRRCTPINADGTGEHPRPSALIGGFRLFTAVAPVEI